MPEKWDLPKEDGVFKQNPTMFVGDQEKDFAKQIGDEVNERIVNHFVIYYPLDYNKTQWHPIYGESLVKKFKSPVKVPALIAYDGIKSENNIFTLDKVTSIKVHFPKRRLSEDLEGEVREGDFVLYGRNFYEIVKLDEPKRVYGAIDKKVEVEAICKKARKGTFYIGGDK